MMRLGRVIGAMLCVFVLGGEVMGKTADLTLAKKRKKDEFCTQLVDIENEQKHYKAHFKDKVVLCNCDDLRKSNFFKYFADNFEKLGLTIIRLRRRGVGSMQKEESSFG